MRERPPGSGSWQLRAWDPVTQCIRTKTVKARTERLADKELSRFVAEVEGAAGTVVGKWTLDDAITAWIRNKKPSDSSRARLEISRTTYLQPILNMRVDRITREFLEGLYEALEAHGGRCPCPDGKTPNHRRPLVCPEGGHLATSTVVRIHNDIRAALEQAVDRGWIKTNPAVKAGPKAPKVEIVPPTDDEVVRILNAVRSDPEAFPLYVCLTIAATLGARRGEQCGLRWPDVDLDRAEMTLRRAIALGVGGAQVEKATKTEMIRKLALDVETVAVLRAYRVWCLERAMLRGVRLGPDAFLFSNDADHSTHWRPDGVTSRFSTLRRKLGLEKIRLHDLRHYMVTSLLADGVDIRTVMGRAGHASLSSATKYAHFQPSRDQVAAESMRRRISPVGTQGVVETG